ncbi:MAG: class I SAM-dependent methyltransferase [Candidatus Marinimicrobia bacterium]|nr:class I SAM-dependent methyltransferase [Candidatus Neomarinimicrobiota bacterium]
MIENKLFQRAIREDDRAFRCPISKDMLAKDEKGYHSKKLHNTYLFHDGIPDFAQASINDTPKEDIQLFWDNCPNESIKSEAVIGSHEYYRQTEQNRFDIHLDFSKPFLKDAIQYDSVQGKKILEIGCGIGLDAIQFARSGNEMYLLDLSLNSMKIALGRFQSEGYKAVPCIGDSENLPFGDNSFDMVYSYGVIHHSPDTEKSIDEIHRVLKPGGQAIIMLYSKWSANTLFRTLFHNGLLKGEIFRLGSIRKVLSNWTELQSKTDSSVNPMTRVFSFRKIRKMLRAFESVELEKHFINRYQMAEFRLILRFIPEKAKMNLHKYLGWNTIIKAKK